MSDLLALIEEQARDERYGYRIPDRPLEFPAGLNPHGVLASRPRYFRSARIVKRRRRRSEVPHGTSAMYKRGCRCDSCRAEQSRRNKAWRRRGAGLVAAPRAR